MASIYRKSEIPDHLQKFFRPVEIGLEATLAEYIATLVAVFRDVRRVLHPTGVCFINLGDSYNSSMGKGRGNGVWFDGGSPRDLGPTRREITTAGLKPKDLMMVPARVALALQDDGWWLRSDCIWHKPNPMPESCRDRPTSAHEHIFLLTKNHRYFYDADAVRTEPSPRGPGLHNGYAPPGQEPHKGSPREGVKHKMPSGWDTDPGAHGSFHRNGRADKQRGHSRKHAGFNDRWDAMEKAGQQVNGANLRNVWTIATQGFPGAHFAVFPPEIPRRCIKAGSKPGDTVLDPFAGSGTTLIVADQLGRDAIGIELNPEYAAMAERRVRDDAPMFAEVTA